MTTRQELMQINRQNWLDNGYNDEVDPAVMKDIGIGAVAGANPEVSENVRQAMRSTRTRSPRPYSGSVRGDSEADTGAPHYHQAYNPDDWPHGPEVAEQQAPYIAQAREALNRPPTDDQ